MRDFPSLEGFPAWAGRGGSERPPFTIYENMKNWQETERIYRRIVERHRAGQPSALATVVRIMGSTYRRPGAKLLIDSDGMLTGNISGGCLENDVREAGLQVIRDGVARVAHYDTSDDEDTVWGLGLGCNGQVDLLIQPSPDADAATRVLDLIQGNDPLVIATALSGERITGLFVRAGAVSFVEAGGAPLEDEAQRALTAGRSGWIKRGDERMFCDVLTPPPALAVIGAGDDALPLARLGNEAGFRVVVIDHRSGYLAAVRFPHARKLIQARAGEPLDGFTLGPDTLVVIKTHTLSQDAAWLELSLRSPVPYIGLLGPRDRRNALLEKVGASDRTRVYGPVGLDLGGEGPEQVALSIVAEALAVWSGRQAGHLRDSAKAIHVGD